MYLKYMCICIYIYIYIYIYMCAYIHTYEALQITGYALQTCSESLGWTRPYFAYNLHDDDDAKFGVPGSMHHDPYKRTAMQCLICTGSPLICTARLELDSESWCRATM